MKMKFSVVFILMFSVVASIPSWPSHSFKANIKTTSTSSVNDGESRTKTTISLVQEGYKFSRRKVNKKETKAWFYCHNANKGCLASCIAKIDGDVTNPNSYNIESLETEHTCMDSVVDRAKEEAIRIMKETIQKNPVDKAVSDIWETVNMEMVDSLTGEARAAFIHKKGKFEDIAKSLYNVRHANIPNNPRDQLEFDTTIDWFNYDNDEDEDGVIESYVLDDQYHRETGRVILFGTSESIRYLATGSRILADGTFKGNLNQYYNLLKFLLWDRLKKM